MDVSILKAILIGTCGLRHSQKCYNDFEYLTIQKHTEIMDCINCQHIVIPSKMIKNRQTRLRVLLFNHKKMVLIYQAHKNDKLHVSYLLLQ